ncbi:MAG: site-2 protease family protein [Desulfurococcaceae archaeon]
MLQELVAISAFMAVWAVLFLLYKFLGLRRYGFSFKPLVLIAKSKRIAEKLENAGYAVSKPWKVVTSIGAVISGSLMVFAFYVLLSNLLVRFTTPTTQAGLYVVIPGLTIGWDATPYFLLAAAITIVVHELFHALSFGSEGVPLRGFGVFFAVLLPGGFVEADNEAFNSSRPRSKMRIYAAGSFSNFMVYLVATALIALTVVPAGVLVIETVEGYPAHGALIGGDVIISINGFSVQSVGDLDRILSQISPESEIYVEILRNGSRMTLPLVTVPSPTGGSKPMIGVKISDYYSSPIPWLTGQAYWHWFSSLYWIQLVSFSVAMINMLPIPLLDGSGFLKALLEATLKGEKRKQLGELMINLASFTSLFLLIANIVAPLI